LLFIVSRYSSGKMTHLLDTYALNPHGYWIAERPMLSNLPGYVWTVPLHSDTFPVNYDLYPP
jgi:hypothetical protein